MTVPAEETAINVARLTRQQCICQEEPDALSCDCAVPVTREQIGRLQGYLSLHPDRVAIYSELAGEWLAALRAFLPESEDSLEAWLHAPFDLPQTADLQHASDLGVLLDMLAAPPVAALS
jgi:hypothetical protein